MRFPPSFIERLRSQARVSEIISRRMPLKKNGREFQGLCPFHNEKSPSFTVNDDKNFFHCFGCGAHGDAIEFVRRYDRMGYAEAVEQLARDVGLPLPQLSEQDIKKVQAEKTLLDVLEAAATWFEKQINLTIGATAMDYIQSRGLTPETMRVFRIGFAPEVRNALHQHLNGLGYKPVLQKQAGLIVIPDDGPAYDRFRGRVMFPIRNPSGKVIAFGGRLLGSNTNKALPKYLNSAENPVFKKGEILYNLDLAKRPARQNNIAVVMEGYMDVVAASQYGVDYSVATLGTAVSADHLRLLWTIASEPVLCLDGDNAGMRAMIRAAEVVLPLLKPGYSLRFAVLPQGEDPDTYVQKHGKASFEKLLSASKRLSQVLWDHFSVQFDMQGPDGRAALEHALKGLTDKIEDQNVRAHYQSFFKKQLWQSTQQKGDWKKHNGVNKKHATPNKSRSPHVEQLMHKQPTAAFDTLAQRMLNVVMRHPKFLLKSDVEQILSQMDIRSPQLDSVRLTLLTMSEEAETLEPAEFLSRVQEKLPGMSMDTVILSFMEQISAEDAVYLWTETLSAYQIAYIEQELKDIEVQLSQEVSEERYNRMIELQQALGKAQKTRSFAPEESDIV